MKHWQARISLVLLVAALTALPAAANAATILLTPPEGVAGPDAETLVAKMKASLEGAGNRVVTSPSGLDEAAAVVGCSPADPTCVKQIADTAGADFLLVTEVESDPLGTVVRITVYRASDGMSSGTLAVPVGSVAEDADYAGTLKSSMDASDEVDAATDSEPTEPAVDWTKKDKKKREPLGKIHGLTWAVGGVGIVLVGVGTAFAVRTNGLQSDLDDAPLTTREDILAAAGIRRRGRTSSVLAHVLLTTGIVATVAAAYLVVDNLVLGFTFQAEPGFAGASASVRF